MVRIQDWVSPKYLSVRTLHSLHAKLLKNKPFPHLALPDFLHERKAKALLKAVMSEEFREKESDLFKFMQTDDFISTKNRTLREFRDFLRSEEFISFMDALTGAELRTGIVDMNGSVYQDTDFLLCHDDRLESRKIAYMLYLSDITKKDGGALSLYNAKNNKPVSVAKRLIPKFNTFTFFVVSKNSFHAVDEIISKKKRISINGWFHE